MEQRHRATSILEFLVAKNPQIRPAPTPRTQNQPSQSNTRTGGHWAPVAFEDWVEFDPKILKTIYGGWLWKVVSKDRGDSDAGLIDYPFLSPFDLQVCDEASTACVIHKWNQTIVTSSLMGVEEFHPSIWRAAKGMNNWNQPSDPALRPDGGAISMDQSSSSEAMFLERLPKDYKCNHKWDSRVIRRGGEFVNNEGKWVTEIKSKHNKVLPIRQVYTYCVEWGCRYGCIISTKEAFIFRIKPCSVSPELSGDEQVKKALKENGLMEYVTVPWDNYSDSKAAKLPQKWTMNLALWFVHILAGNYHTVAKEYPSLSAEKLVMSIDPSTRKSQSSRKEGELKQKPGNQEYPKITQSTRKRARGDNFDTSSSLDPDYLQASQSDNSDADADSESRGSDTPRGHDTDGSIQYLPNESEGQMMGNKRRRKL